MATITFAFTDPEATGIDRPASGSVRCALYEPQSTDGAMRSTAAFHLTLIDGEASAVLSAGVWYVVVDDVEGAGERWVQVPSGDATIAYTDLPLIDPTSIEITPETRPVWQDLAAKVAELAENGVGGGGGLIQAIQHPTYPGVLILTTDPDAVASPTIEVAIVGLPVVGDTAVDVRVVATGAPTPEVAFSVQSQAGGAWYSVTASATGGGNYSLTGLQAVIAGELVVRATATNRIGAAVAQAAAQASSTPASAPVVTLHPQSANLTAGTTISLQAAATGVPTPSVQWQTTDDSGAWVNIDGATQTTYTTPTVSTADDGRRYRAVFRNALGAASSTPAVLTVTGAPAVPLVTKMPEAPTYVFGDTIVLTADATGFPTPTVQWEHSRGGNWQPLTGQTSKTLQLIATRDAIGNYRAVFSNMYGQAIAATASSLTVLPPNGAPFVLTQPPAALQFVVGGLLVIRVEVWSKIGDQFNWQQNDGSGWVAAVGVQSESRAYNPATGLSDTFFLLRLNELLPSQSGISYRCVLSNNVYGGTVISNSTTVTVIGG